MLKGFGPDGGFEHQQSATSEYLLIINWVAEAARIQRGGRIVASAYSPEKPYFHLIISAF